MAFSNLIELQIDADYRNTNNWKNPDDVFNRFFRFSDGKGVNNTSGFRPKSKSGKNTEITDCGFCILVTNFSESEWPDYIDRENGIFIYYGDNRSAGKQLEDTPVGGNRLLSSTFSNLHTNKRDKIPPFLCFEKVAADNGTYMKFLGLACPGAQEVSALNDLVAVWRVKDDCRFQNYRATFTILKEEKISKAWLEDIVAGIPTSQSVHCPKTWKLWVKTGIYSPLKCIRQLEPRSKKHQLPATKMEHDVLNKLYNLTDREFEFAAAHIVQLMDRRFTDLIVTQAVRDGGRDVICNYRVGHSFHQVSLNAFIEAKKWNPKTAVGGGQPPF